MEKDRHPVEPASSISIAESARRIVEVCARVQRGEQVCIVADSRTMPIGQQLVAAARAAGTEPVLVTMMPTQMHGNEPPPVVAAAMRAAQVVIQPVTYAITHTDATQAALAAGARVLVLRGITEDIMTHGAMLADYEEVDRLTRQVAELLTEGRRVRLRSLAGTELTLSIEGRRGLPLTGRVGGAGTFAAMPDGEAAISPVEGSTEGTLVVEHTMDGLGRLDAPIVMTVRRGRVADISGGASAERLRAMVADSDANATNIAEFAIGTNERARLIGSMTEDKKLLGSVHMAIGDNHVIGGTITSNLHLDGLVLRPTVEIDGKLLVKDGRLLV